MVYLITKKENRSLKRSKNSLPLSSPRHLLDFSAFWPRGLFKGSRLLHLITSRVQLPHGPVHWHPYMESNYFWVLGLLLQCLTSDLASPLSMWTLALPVVCHIGMVACFACFSRFSHFFLSLDLFFLIIISMNIDVPNFCSLLFALQAPCVASLLYADDIPADSRVFIALTFPLKSKVINCRIYWTWPLHCTTGTFNA